MKWQQENGRQEIQRARADDVLSSGDAEVRLGLPFTCLRHSLASTSFMLRPYAVSPSTKFTNVCSVRSSTSESASVHLKSAQKVYDGLKMNNQQRYGKKAIHLVGISYSLKAHISWVSSSNNIFPHSKSPSAVCERKDSKIHVTPERPFCLLHLEQASATHERKENKKR